MDRPIETVRGPAPQGVAADGSGFIAFRRPGPRLVGTEPRRILVGGAGALPGLAEGSVIGNPVVLGGDIVVFVADPSGAIGMLRPDGSGGWRSELTAGLTPETLAVVAVGAGLVALGGGETGPVAWLSADGVSWRPLALPAEAIESGSGHVNGAAIVDGRAYLVGQVRARKRGGWRRAGRCGAGRRRCSSPDRPQARRTAPGRRGRR